MALRGKRMSPSSIAIGLEQAAGSAPGVIPFPAAERSDAELVSAVLAGRRSAEAELYKRHARAVAAVAVRLLGRSADAEDVVQDTFLTAFERIRQLRDPQLFRPWLVRITVRHVHRRFRRRRLLRLLGLDRGEDDAALARLALAPFDTETRAELAQLDAALGALSSQQRVAFMLRHVEGYELTEVASACGASLATIKRWLQRADEIVRAHAQEDAP
jgi:RNA polymerase sigma-70 factor (ECF subfamily)